MMLVGQHEVARLIPEFADLIQVSWDTGARPHEVRTIEARHWQPTLSRILIPYTEAKGRRAARAIYVGTEDSVGIITRLAERHPTGPVFRNSAGQPWTANAVKCAFARLEKHVGRRIQHYDFRHTWVTRIITSGVDSHVVAQLAGHATTSMIDRHYSLVGSDHAFLLAKARQSACGESASPAQVDPHTTP